MRPFYVPRYKEMIGTSRGCPASSCPVDIPPGTSLGYPIRVPGISDIHSSHQRVIQYHQNIESNFFENVFLPENNCDENKEYSLKTSQEMTIFRKQRS